MKKKSYLSFLLFFFAVISYSQNDLVILKKDTIRCRIIENGLDWITYESGGFKYKVTDEVIYQTNLQTPDNVNVIPGIFTDIFVKFQENPNTSFTTQDLMKKLDFSSNSPHFKWVEDKSTNTFFNAGIDTSNNKLNWFGLDFSKVNINLGTATRYQYSQTFFLDCNDFVLKDERFEGFRNSFNFVIDTGFVTNRNNNMNLVSIYNKKSKILPFDTIRNILSKFPHQYNGVGLIVFFTDIDKEAESETYYVTFFDIRSKTVLLCLKETSSSKGIGMGWHWTKAIQEYFEILLKKSNWKKRYLKS